MAKYKVVAYSAKIGKKIKRAHSVFDESEDLPENISALLKGGFIEEYDEEEELKSQIKAEELKKKKAAEVLKENK